MATALYTLAAWRRVGKHRSRALGCACIKVSSVILALAACTAASAVVVEPYMMFAPDPSLTPPNNIPATSATSNVSSVGQPDPCTAWLSAAVALSPVDTIKPDLFAADTAQRNTERVLLQSALGQVQRKGLTLFVRLADHTAALTDRCDIQERVRYRLYAIQHLQLSWTIQEDRALSQRYLLIDPATQQQLVLDAAPVFSPNQQAFALAQDRIESGLRLRTVSLYERTPDGWQRRYDDNSLHACESCQISTMDTSDTAVQPVQLPQINWHNNQQLDVQFATLRDDPTGFAPVTPPARITTLQRNAAGAWLKVAP